MKATSFSRIVSRSALSVGWAMCFSITVESLKRFYEPETIHNPKMILLVGVLGLVVNLLGLCLFHEHGHSHGGGGGGAKGKHCEET